MGTRSTISIARTDGTVSTCYCHWDGYPSNNGVLLLVHYQEPEKVKDLIGHGFMSSLGKNVNPVGEHTYDKQEEGVTVFYGRDRKETDVDAVNHKSLKDFAKNGDFQEFDYVYMESKKKWYLFDTDTNKLKPLYGIVSKCRKDMGSQYLADFNEYLKKKKAEKDYIKMNAELDKKDDSPQMKLKM